MKERSLSDSGPQAEEVLPGGHWMWKLTGGKVPRRREWSAESDPRAAQAAW